MKLRYGVLIALLSITLVSVLGACSSSGGPGAASSEAPAVTSGEFEGHEPRDAEELEGFIEKALDKAEIAKSWSKGASASESASSGGEASSGAEASSGSASDSASTASASGSESESAASENEVNGKVSDQFAQANAKYRDGDYAGAESGYLAVLDEYPKHFGANVNLALSQLQQQKNDDALAQALACLVMFPDDDGCFLNVQAAGAACGFGWDDVEDAALRLADQAGDPSTIERLKDGYGAFGDFYVYNKCWSGVDEGLYKASKEDAADAESLFVMMEELQDLKTRSDDEQAEQLYQYVNAVMRQLGMA